MSLEGDLMLPPRGPLKWRWLTATLNKLAIAAGIISPDKSIEINATTGGLSLRLSSDREAAPDEITPWQYASIESGRWLIYGGEITINSVWSVSVEDATVSLSPTSTSIICVEVEFTLDTTTYNAPPNFTYILASGDFNGTPTATIKAVSPTTFAAAQSCLPGSRSSGKILIPLAIYNGAMDQVAPSRNMVLDIYQQDFFITFP